MECEEIGGVWQKSKLVPDHAEEALPGEGNITLTRPVNEQFTGIHGSGDLIVDGHCDSGGPKLRIEFTRLHTDGTTTHYSGEVAYDEANDVSFIVKGRFRRRTGTDELTANNVDGDWETEKPT